MAVTEIDVVVTQPQYVLELSVGSGGAGLPGRGITDADIVGNDLVLTYDQAPFSQNVGRVVGQDGRGITSVTQPSGSTTAQVNYTSGSPDTIALPAGPTGTPGDRYATTSTTSITVPNPNQQVTITVGTGLAYTPQQTVIVANDGIAYFTATVDSYNAGTGVMVLTCTKKHGSGTFNTWTVNLSGAVGAEGPQGPAGSPYTNNPNITEFTSSFVVSNTFELALQASGGGSAIISEPADTEETGGSLLTIANNTSTAGWNRPNNVISFNGNMVNGWVFRTGPTLPTTAENYTALLAVGGNSSTSLLFARSIGFRTVLVGADTFWQAYCTNTTETAVTTTVQLAVNTNYVLQFSKTGNTVLFYINGNLVATIATNVPTGYGTAVMRIVKTNGSASRTAQLYWYYERYTRGVALPFITL